MFQLKIASLRFLSAALLATGATQCLNPARVKADSASVLLNWELATLNRPLILTESIVPKSDRRVSLTYSSIIGKSEKHLLLADNSQLLSLRAEEDPKSRLIRLLTVSFFFLFFVPLGIFYPLFLFYRMLLIKPDETDNIFENENKLDPSRSNDVAVVDIPIGIERKKATVSKLQIAFSPPASDLRKKLSQATSIAAQDVEYDFVDLMNRAIAVMLEQQYWTHVSCDSETLPLDKIRLKFDSTSYQERNKFTNGQSNLINYNRNVTSAEGYERNYSYVVVTLILCTSHTFPLFETINTKEQLAKELVQLSQMKKDILIQFELLWNPQQEDVYISNEQLLIEYSDMTRLF